jgi:2-oxoisovalerate dehydrogenase E1 component
MGPGLNQLLNEVITMNWRSMGTWNCPMVVLAPYGAYLPGLGPWHSQTNEAVYAHMPGLHVVIPSNPADAAGLMRYALRCQRPVLYLYPKALLHGVDETITAPSLECIIPFGKARTVRPGRDVTVVTWGNCVAVSKTAAQRAATEGIETEIIDLRTITPWDRDAVLESVQRTGRLLVVHEDAKTCGLAGDVIAEVTAVAFEKLVAPPLRITKTDDHNPYQYALELSILPSVEGVLEGLRNLAHQRYGHAARTASSASLPAIPMSPSGTSIMPATGMAPLPHPATLAAERAPASMQPMVKSKSSVGKVAIRVPKQSPTDEDATVVKFHVNVGDKVAVGAPLAEMEANKGSYDIESTHAGKVIEICAKAGDRVRVQEAILFLEAPGAVVAEEPVVAESAAGGPHHKEVRLSLAQLQVGALALKSQNEIPTVHVETEADVTSLVRVREQLKAKNPGTKLPTYTHCILWALVQTMKEAKHEGFRGHVDAQGDKLLVAPHASVGFAAVGPNDDLYSPVIKDASRITFPLLVSRAQELTESVRTGSIHAADLQGATVTLTNIGAFEATGGTPFVIPGQVAMLCAGSFLERPRFVNGKIESRTVVNLKLVFDHRPFNGSHAAGFLREIKKRLEGLDLEAALKS